MKLILMRHGDAVPEGPFLEDSWRYLSPFGRLQALDVGKQLGTRIPSVVYSSPFSRALQTTELVLRGAGADGPIVQTLPALCSAGAVRQVEKHIKDLSAQRASEAMFVGHEPSISALATILSGEDYRGAFQRAQAVLIEDGRLIDVVQSRIEELG